MPLVYYHFFQRKDALSVLFFFPFVILIALSVSACGQKKIGKQGNASTFSVEIEPTKTQGRAFPNEAKLTIKEGQHMMAPGSNGVHNNLFNRSF